jgi:hemoglobin-like flavoprotein
MISMVVNKVKKIDDLDDYLFRMGKMHIPFGVKPEHYPIVGTNLLWVLETAFGSQWTPEAKEAWTTFYGIISEKMIKGQLA